MEEGGLPEIMTTKDISRALGISRNRAYEIVHANNFPAFQVGKLYRVRRDKFLKWMDEGGSPIVKD